MSDHFSKQAKVYKSSRPTYPQALYDYLSTLAPKSATVWDCATGSGQAAEHLSQYFQHIIATDLSCQQIEQATPNSKITYREATAEASGIQEASIDLITVAQAIHWFDFDQFYTEAKRVLKAGGYIAVWAYDLLKFEEPKLNETFLDFYKGTLWMGKYWPKERALIDKRYTTLPFPFKEIETPNIMMDFPVNRQGFIDYLGSWSAVQRYKDQHHEDPIAQVITPQLDALWPDPSEIKTMTTQLILRVGKYEL